MSSVESGHVWHDDDDLYDAGPSIVENWELSQQDEMEVLKKRQNEMEEQIKELQCKLAGCGVAAMQNTHHTIARRIGPGEYGYSMSYAEVCRAVDREIALREQRDELLDVVREFVQTMDSLPDSDETNLRVWDVYDTAHKLIEKMQQGES